jgi:hypothetical protein
MKKLLLVLANEHFCLPHALAAKRNHFSSKK